MSALYPKGKKKLLDADIDLLVDDIVILFIDTNDQTYDSADEFIADLAGASIVATSDPLSGKTTTGGVFDADNITVASVSGDPFEAVVLAKDTGSTATSPLIAFFDISTYTPSGADVDVTFDVSGLFAI